MNSIETCVLLSAFALVFAELSPVMDWVKRHFGYKRMKPLDCAFCLAFWLTAGHDFWLLFYGPFNFIEAATGAVLYGSLSSCMVFAFNKLTHRI